MRRVCSRWLPILAFAVGVGLTGCGDDSAKGGAPKAPENAPKVETKKGTAPKPE